LQDIGCDDVSILAGDVVREYKYVFQLLSGYERDDPCFAGPFDVLCLSKLPDAFITDTISRL
jgi:hypothetical protein